MKPNDDTLKTLRELAAFLLDHGYGTLASDIEEDCETLSRQPGSAAEILLGARYWGGSGSYLDLIVHNPEGRQSNHSDVNRDYQALLDKLLTALEQSGLSRSDFSAIHQFLRKSIGP
jgi:hypothetical protein